MADDLLGHLLDFNLTTAAAAASPSVVVDIDSEVVGAFSYRGEFTAPFPGAGVLGKWV